MNYICDMGKQIEIPCETYIKKFLIHSYGQEPVKASKFDPLCLMLYQSLQCVPFDYKPIRRQLDDSIIFELFNNNEIDRRKLYLNDYSLTIAHQVLNNAFYDSMRKFIIYDHKEINNSLGLDLFLKKYGISEDDVKKESLLKDIYRFKKNKTAKCKKFLLVVS